MPASATGVSMARSGPKACWMPFVAPNAPPWRPTSSPRQNTRGSASISSCRAALIASRYVSSGTSLPLVGVGLGEHAEVRLARVGVAVVLGPLDRGADLVADLAADVVQPVGVDPARLRQHRLEP